MAVVHSGKKAEDSLPRQIRQDRSINRGLLKPSLAIEECKEERFIANDGSTKARCVLVPVGPRWCETLPVVGPGVRVQSRVSRIPHCSAVKLIRARSGSRLNLRRTSAFHIHRGNNDTHFLEQVRINNGGGVDTLRVPAIVHSDAVELKVYVARAARLNAGECRSRAAITDDTRHFRHEIHHITAYHRQIHHLLLGKYRSDGR